MATLFTPPSRTTDSNNQIISGAKAYFYASGTVNPQSVYSDQALSTALSNPLITNSVGKFPTAYLNPSLAYRCIVKDASGNVLDDIDPLSNYLNMQSQIDTLNQAISLGTVSALVGVEFATKALMDADLVHAAGVFALVYQDSTATNNDLYVKSGASGSGSWSATGIFSSATAAYSVSAAASATAAAASAASITGTSITRGTTTANTSSATDAAAIFAPVAATVSDGMLSSFSIRVASGATGEIHFIQQQGMWLVNIGVYPITLASGLNSITIGSAGAHSACPTLPDILFIPANTRIAYKPLTGGLIRYDLSGSNAYQVINDDGLGSPVISLTNGVGEASPIPNVTIALSMTVTEGGLVPQQSVYNTSTDTRFVSASLTATGFNIAFDGVLYRNGSSSRKTDARTISAATNIRYDVLYFDLDALTFGLQAGTDRANDAAEFIPAMTSSKRLPLFNLRVSSSDVKYVPVWDVFNGEVRTLSASLLEERRRSKKCLRKTIQRIRRAQNLKYLVIGDSISALVAETPSMSTPNGQYRDRAASTGTTFTYLRDKIGIDAPNYPSLVTSVSMGLADDGAGTVHTKFGFNWEVLNELVADGYTLGSGGLEYYNFAVNGKASADAATGGSLTSWGTAAIALAPHVVVIEFGMNELGNTSTEANLITLAQAFQAAGAEVIFVGVPRRRDTVVGWEYTNRAIWRAAVYTGSAFVSTLALFDNRYTGAVGLSAYDVGTANGAQHPGIIEHRAIGAQLTKLLLD